MVASRPDAGFTYRIGVRNMRKVIISDIMLPVSRMMLFSKDKMNPSPSVSMMMGNMSRGTSMIDADGRLVIV